MLRAIGLGLRKVYGLHWCSKSLGSSLWSGSIGWCVSGMSVSVPMEIIFNSLYSFAQKNPQTNFICTILIVGSNNIGENALVSSKKLSFYEPCNSKSGTCNFIVQQTLIISKCMEPKKYKLQNKEIWNVWCIFGPACWEQLRLVMSGFYWIDNKH